jgi:hypothetical protein
LMARVVFIPKATGGERPLGVVGLLRRLVARAAAGLVLPKVLPWLVERGQFGAGAPAGVEGLAELTQRALRDGQAAVLLDRVAAYSTLHPAAVLAALEKLVPALVPLARVLLSPALVLGAGFASFTWEGLFMGCSLSPVLFALTQEALLEVVRPQLAALDVRTAAFLDDGALLGRDVDALKQAYVLVEAAGLRGGQRLNLAKSFVLAPSANVAAVSAAWPQIKVVAGARVVGVPVGDDAFVRVEVLALVRKAAAARRGILHHLSAQEALLMLRAADGWPKVQHAFRAVRADLSAEAAAAYDEALRADLGALIGEPSPAGLTAIPLVAAAGLPLRCGGLQLPSAALLRGVAHASATVQVRRLLDTAFPPPSSVDSPPVACLPLYLPRIAGRPARDECGFTAVGPECAGSGKCHMPPEKGCARGMCAPCCALARGGDGACACCAAIAAAAAAALEAELPGVTAEVRDAVDEAADRFEAPRGATWAAFACATRYHQPQRAVTCALNGFLRDRLVTRLTRDQAALLDAGCSRGAYSWLLVAPFGACKLEDVSFSCFLRLRLGARVLDPSSRVCATTSGATPRSCTLRGVARGDADAHALSCKCGGHSIATHNYVRSRLAVLLRSWGLVCAEESHTFLSGGAASKMDLELLNGGPARQVLGVDLTRVFAGGRAALALAERAKVTKYEDRYMVPACVRGFAFNAVGCVGDQAVAVADMVACAGARCGAGHADDLLLELWGVFGVALARATTVRMAHFARLSNDVSAHAPQQRALVPALNRFATGMTFGTSSVVRRRVLRPYSVAGVAPPRRRPARGAGLRAAGPPAARGGGGGAPAPPASSSSSSPSPSLPLTPVVTPRAPAAGGGEGGSARSTAGSAGRGASSPAPSGTSVPSDHGMFGDSSPGVSFGLTAAAALGAAREVAPSGDSVCGDADERASVVSVSDTGVVCVS